MPNTSTTDRIAWRRYLAILGSLAIAALTVATLTVTSSIVIDDPEVDGNVTLRESTADLSPGGLSMCVSTENGDGGLVVTSADGDTIVWAETCAGDETDLTIIAADGEELSLLGTGQTLITGGSGDAASTATLNEDGIVVSTDDEDLQLRDTLFTLIREGSTWGIAPTATPRRLIIEPSATDPHNEFLDIRAPARVQAFGGLNMPVVGGYVRALSWSPSLDDTEELAHEIDLEFSTQPWLANGVIVITAHGTFTEVGQPRYISFKGGGSGTGSTSFASNCDFDAGDAGGWQATLTIIRVEEDTVWFTTDCQSKDVVTSNQNTFRIGLQTATMADDIDTRIGITGWNDVGGDLTIIGVHAQAWSYTASAENPAIEE